MIKAGVLGSPISHSLSPLLHRAAYAQLGIAGEYQAYEVKSGELESFLHARLSENFTGFSLTMPLKEEVLSYVPDVDPMAREIASANTVINIDGKWRASSTDYLAFQRLLSDINFSRVAIIGGGGTARAAMGALRDRVDHVDVLLRSPERISALQIAGAGISVEALSMEAVLDSYDLVISTVPAGVISESQAAKVQPSGVLIDVLYHPWPTPLASRWINAGSTVISGRDLLVEQALDQISLMTGQVFDYDLMRKVLFTALL